MAENPGLLNNEEFEKVDHDQYTQDENITSTSMTGEMAEEDRYQGDGEGDLLGDEYTSTTVQGSAYQEQAEPLISFESSPPPVLMEPAPETTVMEPSAPPPPTSMKSVSETDATESAGGLMAIPGIDVMGAWLENVDPRDEVISGSAIDADKSPDVMASPENLPDSTSEPNASCRVVELIYWRDVKKTGIVFGSMMFILISLACCTVMSVLAYLSLCVLTVTVTFRVYKSIMQAVQKTNEGHPFKKLMELKIELKDEVVQDAAENIAKHLNNCTRELRRLYLVEDYVDSLKFGMLLWLLTYVGSWFSGMTLIILVVVSIFILPRVYETYKVQIDTYINMARAQLNKIMAQISAKIPFPKKKAKTQ